MNTTRLSKYEQSLASLLNLHSSLKSIQTQNNIHEDIFNIAQQYIPSVATYLKKTMKHTRSFILSNEASSTFIVRLVTYQLRPIYTTLSIILSQLYGLQCNCDENKNTNIPHIELTNTISFYDSTYSIVYEITHNYHKRLMNTLNF
jgi:hypothetical protein